MRCPCLSHLSLCSPSAIAASDYLLARASFAAVMYGCMGGVFCCEPNQIVSLPYPFFLFFSGARQLGGLGVPFLITSFHICVQSHFVRSGNSNNTNILDQVNTLDLNVRAKNQSSRKQMVIEVYREWRMCSSGCYVTRGSG